MKTQKEETQKIDSAASAVESGDLLANFSETPKTTEKSKEIIGITWQSKRLGMYKEHAEKLERENNVMRHALELIADDTQNVEGWASDKQIADHYLDLANV